MRPSGGVLAVVGDQILDLAGSDLADSDGGADCIGRALFAFVPSSPSQLI